MPVISFGAECSGFLKAAGQAQQSARQLAASALEAQRAVQGLGEGNYSRFVSESDKAARAVSGIQASTTKAAAGAADSLQGLAREVTSVHTALQQMAVNDPGLQELADLAENMSSKLSSVGAQAKDAEDAVSSMAKATTNEQKNAAGSLEAYAVKLGETTIKTQSLSDSLAAGYYDLDRSMGRCFENLLSGAELSFTGVRNAFMGMLADITNQAVTRPITLSLTGSLSGMLSGTGTAGAAEQMLTGGNGGAGGGLLSNLPIGSLLPESWTAGGIIGGLNSGAASLFPSLFAADTTMAQFNALVGNITGAAPGGVSTLTGALGPAGLAAGGTGLLNSLLGVSGKANTISTVGSGLVTGGLMLAGANPLVGLPVALIASLTGKLFGSKKPKRPAVWGGAEIDLGNDNLYAPGSYDFGATFDPKGYGRDAFEMYEDGNYAIATRSRNKASSDMAKAMNTVMREVAEMGVQQADAVQEALPEAYAAAFKAQLSANTVSAEWDFKGDEINEESFKAAAEELQAKLNESMLSAFQGMDFSEYAGRINVDQSALDGLTRFTQAIKLTEETIAATAEIRDPLSEMEQQAKAAKAQLAEWSKAMQAAGVTAEYAGQLVSDYSDAMIGKFIGEMEKSLNPLSQYAQAQKDANDAVDDRLAALTMLGATEQQLAQVEGMRSQVLEATLGPMRTAFEQDARLREAQLAGNGELLSSTQLAVQHEKELTEIRAKFGEDSAEYTRVVSLQGQELVQLAAQLEAQRTGFAQNLQIRQAQLSGDSDLIASIQLTIQHERELAEIRTKFGAESVQYAQMQYMQIAEVAQLAWQQQQSAAQKALQEQQAALQKQLQEQSRAAQEALSAAAKAESEANAALSKAQSHLNAVRSAYLSALNKEASGLKSAIDAVSRAVEQLSRTRRDLLADAATSTLGTADRYAFAGAELERTFARAMSGDAEAMAELATLSSKYLDVSKEANADFTKYRKDFEKVQTMLAAVEAAGGMQNDTAQKQLDLLNAQIAAATEGTGQIVGSIKELEIAFVAALGDYNAAQEAARKAQEAADEARRKAEEAAQNAQNNSQNGSNGSQGGTTTAPKTWMQDVLDRKATAMNRGDTLGPGQTAGGWTADRVLQEIISQVGSFAEWYARYGKLEGFAKGGVASGWAIVGEQGPELVNFSQPGRVYTADDTAEMLKPSAFAMPDISGMAGSSGMSGTSGRFKSDARNAELLQEIRALRREVAELRAEQSRSQFRIADAAQRTARKLEQFDFDGLPGTREQ